MLNRLSVNTLLKSIIDVLSAVVVIVLSVGALESWHKMWLQAGSPLQPKPPHICLRRCIIFASIRSAHQPGPELANGN